ncbi:Uncharacterised protein [Mycobacteroides abscessus subsp. abscessus]|nr:Uncharacterised protein [Mycobacteroides abscessus subsp. abscessus]
MHHVVVLFDLSEINGVTKAGCLIQVARVGPQHRGFGQLLTIAFEVSVVDGIEANQRGEQPHICLGDGVTYQITLSGKPFRQPIQRGEQSIVGGVISGLITGETAAVHPVVDFGVDAAVYLVDFWAQVRGVQLRRTRAVIFGPLGGEVQRHLRIVIGDDLTGGLLDYGRHGDAARVVRIPLEVGVTQKVDAQDRVDSTRVKIEGPAALVMGRPAKSQ